MNQLRSIIISAFICLLLFLPSKIAWAFYEIDLPTLTMFADYGMTTHQSQIAESNEISTSSRYGIAAYAGIESNLVIQFRRDFLSTSFSLNEASMKNHWRDIMVGYRWQYFTISAVASDTEFSAFDALANQNSELSASGYGLNLYAGIPLGELAKLNAELIGVTIDRQFDFVDSEAKFGPRLDVDINVHYHIIKNLVGTIVGYRARSIQFSNANLQGRDLLATLYAGLFVGITF